MSSPLPTASSWEMLLVYLKRRRYVRVINESMIPTLYPGDVVILNEGAYRRQPPQPDDIVVALHPEWAQPKLIKRVQHVHDDGRFFLISDNATLPESRDSRFYGPFAIDSIIGKITSKLPKSA